MVAGIGGQAFCMAGETFRLRFQRPFEGEGYPNRASRCDGSGIAPGRSGCEAPLRSAPLARAEEHVPPQEDGAGTQGELRRSLADARDGERSTGGARETGNASVPSFPLA